MSHFPTSPFRAFRNLIVLQGGLICGMLMLTAQAEPLRDFRLNHQNAIPARNLLKERLSKFLNQEYSATLADAISEAVLQHYQAQDHPVVQVSLSEDAFQRGVLQVDIAEGRVGEIQQRGGAHLAPYSSRLATGDFITGTNLQRELDWMNRNPFRQATLTATPGASPEIANLEMNSSDQWPLTAWTTYSNDGVHPLDGNRWLAGLSVGDLFRLDHTLTVQGQMADDPDEYHLLMGEWKCRLPWRHEFSLSGAGVGTEALVSDDIKVDGSAWFASARYRIPWRSSLSLSGESWLGLDRKHFSTDLLFGGAAENFHPITMTTLDVGSQVQYVKGRDSFEVAAEAVWSPGDWLGSSDDVSFGEVAPGAQAAFFYLRGHAKWQHVFRSEWSVHSGVYGQWSDGELLSSEAFYLTGANAVRGYEERSVLGSKGIRATLETRTPALSIPSWKLQAQVVGFVDGGHTWTEQSGTEDPVSMGTGLRAQLGKFSQLRCEVAWPLTDHLAPRLHVNLTLTF